MSYESLKESIAEAIRPNGNQEITGQILQDVLLNILDEAAASDKNIVDKINKDFEDANQALQALVGKKADKEGTYPKMSVGFAQEIVGDGSATEEEFSFRPTAGEDRNVANTTYYDGERNGVARIEKVKGNSVVWNQLVNTDTTNIDLTANHKYITNIGGTISIQSPTSATTINVSGDADKVTDLTQMFGAGNEPTTVEEFWARIPEGVDINAYNEGEIVDGNYGAIKTVGFNAFNGTYAKVCGGCPYYLGGNYTSLGFATEESGTTEAIAIPTSTESVGTTPSDRLYTPSQNGYIYAEGENININLSWDTEYGYLNGTLQPYKPFERDISWVAQYFPNGMRSAGSVRDEVRFNSTTQKWEAVQRVGVVDLGSLSWTDFGSNNIFLAKITDMESASATERNKGILCDKYIPSPTTGLNSSMSDGGMLRYGQNITVRDSNYATAGEIQTAMQGIMLNYELAEPIVTEIENVPNMDFDVSDYGTEEFIAQEGKASAPIVADIAYAPNALSTLKQVPDILARLKALETAVASATSTTNMEE